MIFMACDKMYSLANLPKMLKTNYVSTRAKNTNASLCMY